MASCIKVRRPADLHHMLRQQKSIDGKMAILMSVLGPLQEERIIAHLREVGISPNLTRGVFSALSQVPEFLRLVGPRPNGTWVLESAGCAWFRHVAEGEPAD